MTLVDIEALRDFILLKNPYFQKGYANAFKESITHTILCKSKSGDLDIVSPRDDFGNYFYLRNDEFIRHDARKGISDSGAGRTMYLDTMRINYVSIMKDGDPMLVADNIINTVAMYKTADNETTCQMITSNWNREQIIINELQGMEQSDINAALQRLGNHLIMKIIFDFSKLRIPNKCINPICAPC